MLRRRHAEQAANVLSIPVVRPGTDQCSLILENSRLRDAFASTIGRIASSHHWSIPEVAEHLSTHHGGCPDFPAEWQINEVKVALLLRCADAAHIDRRRAPTVSYFLEEPKGISENHWRFQNKINRPTKKGSKLFYSSSEPFLLTETDAWWLAYETARMIDKEIRGANAFLDEIQEKKFEIQSVGSVEEPELFAKHVKVVGWKPVNAEVQVTDPVHLAKTLGGRNLYGNDALAPLRELLQNSVDAIRARRAQENRAPDWGHIDISLVQEKDGLTLHIDDDGIGMSERVITGPLIDFGKSFWSSNLIRDEFPGLSSKYSKSIGKFGIGFFSVFLLGDNVRVVSKRYDKGSRDAMALEFSSLNRRPLLRPAYDGELPIDMSTRVSIKLSQTYPFEGSKFVKRGNDDVWSASLLARVRTH